MQKKKIFVEIEIPRQIKKRLVQASMKWQNLPVKWTKEANLHLTVAFVGYVDESVIPDICDKVCNAVKEIESFELDFENIEYGPTESDPKMIWLTGQPSHELGILNELIEKALGMRPNTHKEFRPHITMGRIRKIKWDQMNEKPSINERMRVSMTVDNVSIMESVGGGAEYISLEECPLV